MSKLLADKKKLFDIDKDNLMFHNKALFALLIPIVVEQLLNSFMGMVDTMMVSNLGSQAISGVSLVDSVNNLIVQLFSAMATGAAIICSHYIGMKDREGANKAARQVVLTVATIAVVRKRTELKGSGRFTELPDTRLMAIASPMARPVPSTIAVIIPALAAGSTTWKIVWILVAPIAREALLKCRGTALRADSLMLITEGRIIRASTSTTAIRYTHPVNW